MKKFSILIFTLLFLVLLSSCTNINKLYVLNVGDYIDMSLVEAFEEEHPGWQVVYTETNSNEEIYQKLKNEYYDICVVSDYMIDRMYQENLLKEMDFNIVSDYYPNLIDKYYEEDDSDFKSMIDSFCSGDTNKHKYFSPYFCGTLGILYNNSLDNIEEYLEEEGMSILFNNEHDYNIGMYNSARDALAAAIIAINHNNPDKDPLDFNTENIDVLRQGMELLKSTEYRAWGDDNLKALVNNGFLDLALVYSGDYFDEVYQCMVDSGLSEDEFEPSFGYYAPKETNIWFDAMVITSKSEGINYEMANEFIEFFQDPEISAQNADYIGYMPLNKNTLKVLAIDYEYFDYDISDEILDEINDEESINYRNFDLVDFDSIELNPIDDLYIVTTSNHSRFNYIYRHVSEKHCNILNDLLDEAKS